MFSSSDVDVLFANTNRSLQRSMLLLDEHAPASPTGGPAKTPPPQQSSMSSTAFPTTAVAEGQSPTAFGGTSSRGGSLHSSIAVVQSLRGLGQFRAFVDVAIDMADRLAHEAATPSAAMVRQRLKGVLYPALARTVRGLRVRHLWARSPDAQRLWWRHGFEAGGGSSEQAPALGGTPSEESSGASVAGRLFLAALCADLSYAQAACLQLVRQWDCRPAAADASLLALLESLTSPAGGGLPHEVLEDVTDVLSALLLRLCPPRLLSAGTLLLPGWAAYLAVHAPPAPRTRLLLRPLSSLAGALPTLYLRDESHFALACRQCLLYTSAVAAQVFTTDVPTGEELGRRKLALTQALYNALLLPMEERFTADVARPGMARALNEALAIPFADELKPALLAVLERAGCPDGRMGSLLHTVHYRLLLLVERIGRSELARESGSSAESTAAQQKRYEGLLKQSHGKITVHLLSAIAEDRQLVFEASDARAHTGHVLHRLHDGSEDPGSAMVHLYVDNGSVLYKMGRARAFTTAKSVEEIFKPFNA